MTAVLQFGLLGKLQIILDGQSVEDKLTTKAQALLVYLVMTQQAHTRHSLAGLFWGDSADKKAKNSLRVALSSIRRLLPNVLLSEWQTIAFDLESEFALDVTRFANKTRGLMSEEGETAVSQADLEAAVLLYRDDFLTDFHIDDAPEFEEWVLSQRAQWQEIGIKSFTALSQRYMQNGRYRDVITTLHRLLQIEPWQESAHRELMLAHSRMGNYNAALAQYETCRRLLDDELGVEPMPETDELMARVQQARTGRPSNLPAATTPFVGRQTELNQISTLLADPNRRLISLIGLGGMGKTRLALEAARRANAEHALLFINGVMFVNLAAVTTPDDVPRAIVQALNLPFAGDQKLAQQLLRYLKTREMLLVLDNFEQILSAASFLGTLLDRCPNIKLLVTSREPLLLAAEWRLDIGGLTLPEEQQAAVEENGRLSGAVALFAQTASQVRPDFSLSEANIEQIGHICRLLSGVPLAIKLAATWLRLMTIPQVAEEISRSLDFLATRMRDVPARQHSMRAVFRYTWDLLSPDEQRVFRGLSVFRGPFSAEAAIAIIPATPFMLATLVDKSLMQAQTDEAIVPYFMHELTRQYAAEQLAADPQETANVATRHWQYYRDYLRNQFDALSGNARQEAVADISRNIGNIRAAWRQIIAERDVAAVGSMTAVLYKFYTERSWFNEGIGLLTEAIEALETLPNKAEKDVRINIAWLQARRAALVGGLGRFDEASRDLRTLLQTARTFEQPVLITFILDRLSNAYVRQDEYEAARALNAELQQLNEELDNRQGLAQGKRTLGYIEWSTGNNGAAMLAFTTSLAIFQAINDQIGIGAALNDLGIVALANGSFADARSYFSDSLAISRQYDPDWKLGLLLGNLALATYELGDYEQSLAYSEESLAVCRISERQDGIASALESMAVTQRTLGNLAEAERLHEESRQINEAIGRRKHLAMNLHGLGIVAREQGEYETARGYHMAGTSIFSEIGHRWGEATSQTYLAQTLLAADRVAEARQTFKAALQTSLEIHAESISLEIGVSWAEFLLDAGQTEAAVNILTFVERQETAAFGVRTQAKEMLASVEPDLVAQAAGKTAAFSLSDVITITLFSA